MPKRVLQSQSTNMPKRQAKISSFVRPQHSSKSLKSRDGLVQGRIEAFMVKKSETENLAACLKKPQQSKVNSDNPETSLKCQKRLRNPNSKGVTEHCTEETINLTDVNEEEYSGNQRKSSGKVKRNLLKTIALQSYDDVDDSNERSENKSMLNQPDATSLKHDDISECIDLGEAVECTVYDDSMSQKGDEATLLPSEADLCLDDSFINAAFDGLSPMKKGLQRPAYSELLPFSVTCTSTAHSLVPVRFKVQKVSEPPISGYTEEKILLLENVGTKRKLRCRLCNGWVDLSVAVGDIVNIIGNPKQMELGEVTIDARNNFIILHPDTLLSGTSVSNAIGCRRRGILNERFKNTEPNDSTYPYMLIGTIVHSLFQSVLQLHGSSSAEKIAKLAEEEVSKLPILREILSTGTTQKELLKEVQEFIPHILSWCAEYVKDTATYGVGPLEMKLPFDYTNDSLGVTSVNNTTKFSCNIALSKVRDIEENVWSPMFGLKGKIDATGDFVIKRHPQKLSLACKRWSLPLELKTGNTSHSIEHHAQVAIYSLFNKQRRGQSECVENDESYLPAGLLLYLKSKNLSCIPLRRDDERELIMIRNQVVNSLVKSVVKNSSKNILEAAPLLATIDDERLCSRCSQLRNCALVSRSVDKTLSSQMSDSMHRLTQEQTSHLTENDLQYFSHWFTCILLEARKSMKNDISQYYWLRSPEEREEAGSCLTNLVLAGHGTQSEDGSASLQAFKRSSSIMESESKFSSFAEGELVVISGNEPNFVGMASGTIYRVSERCFDGYSKNMKYSIDKHVWPSMNSFNTSFRNLSVIMQDTEIAKNLRDKIIHHKNPTFKSDLQEVVPRSSKDEIAKMLRGLNRTQRQAIKRVLLSNDFTLVVGMPGSGKTTTIVAMVRILLLCGCRILLTSYTHSAIDNLLMKMIKYKVKFLRIGRLSQIHPSLHKFSEEELAKDIKSPEQLDKLYSDANVVGCTCLAVTSHALFASKSFSRKFDICIVDEASQISQPACLAPLLHADRFVLVGDHRQLPPLVRSRKAKSDNSLPHVSTDFTYQTILNMLRSMGADESLFWRLTRHRNSLCELTLQYRMNRTIMDVSNYVTYEGRLECATEANAVAKLTLSYWKKIKHRVTQLETISLNGQILQSNDWMLTALNPEKPVVFLDTSNILANEEETENGFFNKTEAEVLRLLLELLIQGGCRSDSIGVIAPFRKQLQLIQENLDSSSLSEITDVEVSTVDKYQGRDKEVILMSFVRSKSEELGEKAGELLSDWRRLNVALTRAKHKMILIGCRRTLKCFEPCKKLLTYLDEKGQILPL